MFLSSPLGQREITHFLRQHFFENQFPPPQQKEGGTMALSSLLNKKDPGTTNHAFEEREVFSSRHLPAQS